MWTLTFFCNDDSLSFTEDVDPITAHFLFGVFGNWFAEMGDAHLPIVTSGYTLRDENSKLVSFVLATGERESQNTPQERVGAIVKDEEGTYYNVWVYRVPQTGLLFGGYCELR